MPFPAPVDKDPVADYLERYAAESPLPVRLNSRVISLRRIGDQFEAPRMKSSGPRGSGAHRAGRHHDSSVVARRAGWQ
jgi:hypothetical protein